MKYLKFLFIGIYLGIVLTKAEAISWFRIQEMFRFQSFHMYGLFATAIPIGMLSVFLIRRFKLKTIQGEAIVLKPKEFNKVSNFAGGLLFGLGWALTGACPGPIYALIGNGVWVFLVVFLSALAGTFAYGLVREKLPH